MSSAFDVGTFSRTKRFAFHLILTVSGTILLLVAGELLARLLPQPDDPYLVLRGRISFFSEVSIHGRRYYEVSHPDSVTWGGSRFAIEKVPGTSRIFVLGGSAAAGWPHPSQQTFSAYLEALLRREKRPAEVLNVSGHGFASYRVRDIFEDVLEFDPDLLILWSGNNELFEERSYPRLFGLGSLLRHSYLLRAVSRLTPLDSLNGLQRDNERARHSASSKIRREPHRMRADPVEFQSVKDHFAFSVGEMLRAAEQRGVPVLVLTVPVNLRDWWPQVSHNGLAGANLANWRKTFDSGHRRLQAGEPERSVESFERALVLEPEHAESHFLLGRALEKIGEEHRAAVHYRRASDLDYSPLRAHSDLNVALRGLAAEHRGAQLLDLEAVFQERADGAAPGFDLFLDYVHPTRRGNWLVARSVLEAIREHRLLGIHGGTGDSRPRSAVIGSYSDWGDDSLQARLFLLSLAMHQHEAAELRGRRLLAERKAHPELMNLAVFRRHGLTVQRLEAMVEQNAWFLKMERRRLRGVSYRRDYEQHYENMLVEIFGRFGMIEELASGAAD